MDFTSVVILTMSLLHANMQPVTGLASEINTVSKRITSDSNSSRLPINSGTDLRVQESSFTYRNSLDTSETINNIPIKKSALSKRQVSSRNVLVHTKPESRIVLNGSTFHFLCETRSPIFYCRISTPITKNILTLHEKFQGGSNYRYYGKGLARGQCGIEIDHIDNNGNGNFSCIMGSLKEPEELVGSAFVTVAKAPTRVDVSIVSLPVYIQEERFVYKENTTLVAECRVASSRPAANISWFINEKLITEGIEETRDLTPNSGLVDVQQKLTQVLTREDDGMELKCKASHFALDKPITRKKGIVVYYSPQVKRAKIQDKKKITVEINANPKPKISWTVGDTKIREEDPESGFEVSKVENKGKNLWQSTLTAHSNVSKLQDGTKYTIFATNIIGNTSYEIIGAQDSDEDIKLGTEVIAGIVMAGLVVVSLIGTMLYAFVTRRWCFDYDIRLGDRPCF